MALTYTLINNNTEYAVSKCDNTSTTEAIPATYNGLPVTSIGASAFKNCAVLTEVEIGVNVTSIGMYAFSGCTSLTSITTPTSNIINNVSMDAFDGCDSLMTAYEGINYIKINNNPYYLLHNWQTSNGRTQINIHTSTKVIADSAFFNNTSATSISIPEGVISIGSWAFCQCKALKTIIIPNSVINLGVNAFERCSALTNATISDSVKSIGQYTFNACSALTTVTIGESVEIIGDYAFANCPNLKTINAVLAPIHSISTTAFNECNTVTENSITYFPKDTKHFLIRADQNVIDVVLPYGTRFICNEAFKDCTNLKTVTNENTPTIGSVCEKAFYNCTALESIAIGYTAYIGAYAFYNCTKLTNLDLYYNRITKIRAWTFCACRALTNLTLPVDLKSIDDFAFDSCDNLTEITIPNSVKSIGNSAFSWDTSLTTVTFEDNSSLTSIGNYAFGHCTSLNTIVLPSSITSIGESVFHDCGALTNITIPFVGSSKSATEASESTLFGYIFGTVSYNNSVGIEQKYSSSNPITYYIPTSLKSITVTGGSLLYGAFYKCSNLTSVTLGDSITSVGERAFYYCSSLKTISISKNSSISSIDTQAFCGCSTLESINIPNSVASLGGSAFEGCSALPEIIIGSGITSIGENAFANCSALSKVTLNNDNIIEIGSAAFYPCTKLESVYITNLSSWCNSTFTSAGSNPLYNGANLYLNEKIVTNLVIPDNTTEIKNYAFYGCTSITSVVIDNSVTSIGNAAFYYCTSLTNVTIGGSITTIISNAFYGCDSLTSVNYLGTIESWCGITFVGSYANPLNNGAKLHLNGEEVTNLVIPDTVTEINDYAFYNCTSITSIIIPDSVTSIGGYAFKGCPIEYASIPTIAISRISINKLKEVVITSGDSIENSAFALSNSLTKVTVGDSVKSIADYAFAECDSLATIVIPSSIDSIGTAAFMACTALSRVYYKGDESSWDNIAISSEDTPLHPDGESDNKPLTDAVCFFTPEVGSVPLDNERYWYYDDNGQPVLWTDCLEFTLKTDNTYEVSGFKEGVTNTAIIIPATYNGISVTNIAYRAFFEQSEIALVKIGNNVKTIKADAFNSCSKITAVTLGTGITTIYNYAFSDCSNIEDVYYLGTLEQWCKIDFGTSVWYYATNPLCYGANLYIVSGELKELKKLEELEIPTNITQINPFAFSGCTSLTTVTIHDNVTSIGYAAFNDCYNIASMSIPFAGGSADTIDTTTTIRQKNLFGYIFGDYSYLLEDSNNADKLVETAQYVGKDSNGDNTYFTCYLPANLTSIKVTGNHNISTGAFGACNTIKNVKISGNTNIIGHGAFDGCAALESLSLPNSVTTIESYAVSNCASLTTLYLGSDLTSVGNNAFVGTVNEKKQVYYTGALENWCKISFTGPFSNPLLNCKQFFIDNKLLTNLVIPADSPLSTISAYAFYGYYGLKSVKIEDGATVTIGSYAFRDCKNNTEVILGNKVDLINSYAFAGNTSLEKLKIGDNITTIYSSAFSSCEKLSSVTIPNSVISLSSSVFSKCTSLNKVSIGSGVISIGSNTFSNCTSLKELVIPDKVTSLGNGLLTNCISLETLTTPFIGNKAEITTTPQYPFGYLFTTTAPTDDSDYKDKLIRVEQTFYGTNAENLNTYTYYVPNSLKTVTVTKGTTVNGVNGNILYGAFENCANLETINLSKEITNIGDYAFASCTQLSKIELPNSIQSIGEGAFHSCVNLEAIDIPDNLTALANYVFYYSGLINVTIPENITKIGVSAFEWCPSLTSVTIPNTVVTIDSRAFKDCISLTNLTINNSDETAVELASDYTSFENCPIKEANIPAHIADQIPKANLTKVTITGGKGGTICEGFFACDTLETVVIANNITEIRDNAFGHTVDTSGQITGNCSNLKEITIGTQVAKIGWFAFSYCTALIEITIPESVTTIGGNAFEGCTRLESITLPKLLTSIGEMVFEDCTSLASITIGNSITKIGDSAFEGCTSLESVHYLGSTAEWCDITFGNAVANPLSNGAKLYINETLVTDMVIPNAVTTINDYAFYNCDSITSVVIGNSVTSIDDRAFYNCSKLNTLTIENGSSVTIASDAFTGSGITEATIPANVILKLPVDTKEGLTKVTITGATSVTDGTKIPDNAFSTCAELQTVSIDDIVTEIGANAFEGCKNLARVYIGEGITTIKNGAFHTETDSSITERGVYIKDLAKWCKITFTNFYSNPLRNLGELYLRKTGATDTYEKVTKITIIDDYLSENTIEGEVSKYLNNQVFRGCTSITKVTINTTEDFKIGERAFAECTGLTNVTLSNKVKQIAYGAFGSCRELTNISIPNSVTIIGKRAFENCSISGYPIIPIGVKTVGEGIFYGCNDIIKIRCKATSKPAGWDENWHLKTAPATTYTLTRNATQAEYHPVEWDYGFVEVSCYVDYDDEWIQEGCHWKYDRIFNLVYKLTDPESKCKELELSYLLGSNTVSLTGDAQELGFGEKIWTFPIKLTDQTIKDLNLRTPDGWVSITTNMTATHQNGNKYNSEENRKFYIELPPEFSDPNSTLSFQQVVVDPGKIKCSWTAAGVNNTGIDSVDGYCIELWHRPEKLTDTTNMEPNGINASEFVQVSGLYFDPSESNRYVLKKLKSVSAPIKEAYIESSSVTEFYYDPDDLEIVPGDFYKFVIYPYSHYITPDTDSTKALISSEGATANRPVLKGIIRVVVGGEWKEGQVWVMNNNEWKVADAIYVKQDDEWKKTV